MLLKTTMKRVPIGGFSVSSKSHEPFLASVSFKDFFFPYFHASIHVWTSGGNSYCKGCHVWSMIVIHKEPKYAFSEHPWQRWIWMYFWGPLFHKNAGIWCLPICWWSLRSILLMGRRPNRKCQSHTNSNMDPVIFKRLCSVIIFLRWIYICSKWVNVGLADIKMTQRS